MTKLIYRGINYKFQKQNEQVKKPNFKVPVDQGGSQNISNSQRLISIRPMNYYTYRGVSYSKNLISDSHKQILLDIERQ